MSDIMDRLLDTTDRDAVSDAREEIAALRAEVERLTSERDRQYQQNAEQITRIAALEAENERLRTAVHNCISLLDGLVAESGRSIEWGEEDPFRMGEWFETGELEQIEEARAALEEKP